jgi:hypothetical protein
MDARRNSTPTVVDEDMEAMGWEIYPPLPELVASGEYSDFNIVCDEQLYQLHQAIVCPQSRSIRAACSAMQVRDWVTLGYVAMKANRRNRELRPRRCISEKPILLPSDM